ncbi:hypothetical protein [Catenibacterium mitsuokai]|nr:hypothetical protein [Catenibacterium mitsuokai]
MKLGFKDAIFSAAFKTFSYLLLVLGGNTSKDKVTLSQTVDKLNVNSLFF